MASADQSSNLPQKPAVVHEGTAAATAQFRSKMMGADKDSLNLGAIRSRAEDMRKALEQVIRALQVNAHNIKWSDVLDRFAVLAVQYQSLVEQLRPLVKLFVVHPKSVNAHNATMLPIMLASKALPEMDAANASLLSDIQTRYKGSLEAAYEPLSSAEDAHNALVRFLTVSGGREGSGVLDAKGPLRTEITHMLRGGARVSLLARTGSGVRPIVKADPGAEALLHALTDGKGFRRQGPP